MCSFSCKVLRVLKRKEGKDFVVTQSPRFFAERTQVGCLIFPVGGLSVGAGRIEASGSCCWLLYLGSVGFLKVKKQCCFISLPPYFSQDSWALAPITKLSLPISNTQFMHTTRLQVFLLNFFLLLITGLVLTRWSCCLFLDQTVCFVVPQSSRHILGESPSLSKFLGATRSTGPSKVYAAPQLLSQSVIQNTFTKCYLLSVMPWACRDKQDRVWAITELGGGRFRNK